MILPNYSSIYLSDMDDETIFNQLNPIDLSTNPLVINIEHLGDSQLSALENLENYFELYHKSSLPYGIYIISSCTDYDGKLFVCQNFKDLPRFYHHKSRPLNSKESSAYKKVKLKQQNLKNIQNDDFVPTMNRYAEGHKKIYELEQELNFIKKINIGLDKYYGK